MSVADVFSIHNKLRVRSRNFERERLERERRDGGRIWIYEAKILMPDGDVFEVEYDARSLEVLDLKGPEEG